MVPFFGRNVRHAIKDLVVPLSEGKHRLYKHEIPEVIEALKLYLEKRVEKSMEKERAEIAFRTLHRLTKSGRPKYPEFSWVYLEHYLDFHENETLRSA